MKVTMKLVLASVVLAFMVSGTASAAGVVLEGVVDPAIAIQDSQPGLIRIDMQEQESEEPAAEKKPSEWGGFGGPLLMYLTLDTGAFEPMTDDRDMDNFDGSMVMVGGLGGLIHKDFRFGGFGFGGSQDVADRDAADERISAEMSIGGGGLFFEANRALNPSFGVLAGTMIGAGGLDFKASGADLDPLGIDGDWDADASFFLAYPYLGLWVAPTNWMWVQLDAGYMYFDVETTTSEWENDLDVEMIDGDLSGGFQADLRVCFGYKPGK